MAQFDLSITLEYDIITASDSAELVAKVNEAIQTGEGWQPLGGVAVVENDDNWAGRVFYQAVVRGKPEKKPAHLGELAEAIKRTNRIMSDES